MMLRSCAGGNGGGFRYTTLRLLFMFSAAAFLLTVLQFGFSQRRMTLRRIKGLHQPGKITKIGAALRQSKSNTSAPQRGSTHKQKLVSKPNHITWMSVNDQLSGAADRFFNSSDETIGHQQKQRHQLIAQQCAQLPTDRPMKVTDWSEFLVDDERKYIYCKVEKVACTSWKRALLDLTGQFQNAEKLNFYRVHSRYVRENVLRPLSVYKPAEIDFRLKTYFKFMFTRHPFERLVSAYRSKVKRDKDYKGLQSRIKRRQKKRKSSQSGEFAAFVRFVLEKAARGRQLDVHWRPQYDICRPCTVTYDFIGRYETLYHDADYVLKRLQTVVSKPEVDNSTYSGSSRNTTSRRMVKFPRSDPDNKRTNSMYLVRKMMSEMLPDDIERLKKLYDRDFRLYGYL